MHIQGRLRVGFYICLAWASTVVATGEEVRAFHFDRLNRTYTSFVQDLASIELGAVHIDLASPEHSMTLERHTVRLEPLGGGSYRAALEIDFHGGGLLEADLLIGAIDSHLSDELTIPQQGITLEGRIRIDSRSEGYEITLLEIDQKEVAVRIQSKLAGRIVPLCHQLALVLVRLGCDALEEALTIVRVAMPPAGEVYFLFREELTETEAELLDAFLAAHS